MSGKMMRRLVQSGLTALAWFVILPMADGLVYRAEWFHIIPFLGIGFCVLSILFPAKWSMGIAYYKKANILEKVSPLVFSVAVLVGMGLLPQTITIVILETFFFSNSLTYASYVVSDIATAKIRKFAGAKKG